MLTPIAKDLWVAHEPDFRTLGLRLGTRMTAVRLANGEVWVHSPLRLDDELRSELDALGPVRHIVCPNLYHHLFAKPLAEAYPEARVYGPAKLRKKRTDLTIHQELESLGDDGFDGELVPVPIEGCLLGETAFVHVPSRSIVSADLTENFQTSPHWPTRVYLRLSGIHGRIGLSPIIRLLFRDKKATRRSIDRLLSFDAERAVIAHGDAIIEGDVRRALEDTYRFLG